MEREKELQSLLDIYKILRQDESEFNLYNNSTILEELIEKTEKDSDGNISLGYSKTFRNIIVGYKYRSIYTFIFKS